MRSLVIVIIVAAVYVSMISVSFESKQLGQHRNNESPAGAGYLPYQSDQNDGYFSSYSFSQVFGFADNATAESAVVALSISEEPPPIETWLLDPNSFIPDDPNVIPRTINKIFFQRGSGFPSAESMTANLTMAHKSWEEMNPGYKLRYFDLNKARKYLGQHFHPVFLRAFDCLTAFAAKSDLFRMALLFREGGWHSDWKQVALRKHALSNISAVTDIFAAYDLWNSNDFFPHKCVQNAFVGSRPRHPIIAKMLDYILRNVQTVRYVGAALDATSTCIFGRAVHVSEEERNSTWFSEVAGKYVADEKGECVGCFQWDGKFIVKHKCDNCGGSGQDWGIAGNNYILLYKHRKYYCDDAASLFSTTESW